MQTIDPQTGKKFTTRDLLTTGATFMYEISGIININLSNAGSDTTAVTLTFLLYNLLAKRDYWNRLVTEVFDNITSPDEIFKSQFNLPFLNACVSESNATISDDTNCSTSISTAGPIQSPTRGCLSRSIHWRSLFTRRRMVYFNFFWSQTTVSTPLYAILHDSRYFYQPESFLPERWLDGGLKDHPMNKDAWFPFSKGPRNCVGKT